jgi:hypothetical protein
VELGQLSDALVGWIGDLESLGGDRARVRHGETGKVLCRIKEEEIWELHVFFVEMDVSWGLL